MLKTSRTMPSPRSRLGASAAFLISCVTLPANAAAQDPELVGSGDSVIAGEDRPATTVIVKVGRALDLEGIPVYPVKTSFSGRAEVQTPSTSPSAGRRMVAASSLNWSRPLARSVLTSGFGRRTHPLFGGTRMHSGVDLAAPYGSPVVATSDGIVSSAGWSGGYGLTVRLVHGAGIETRYAHLSGMAVTQGQSVSRGTVIGYVGTTGVSTGAHLHFELRQNGQAVQPLLE